MISMTAHSSPAFLVFISDNLLVLLSSLLSVFHEKQHVQLDCLILQQINNHFTHWDRSPHNTSNFFGLLQRNSILVLVYRCGYSLKAGSLWDLLLCPLWHALIQSFMLSKKLQLFNTGFWKTFGCRQHHPSSCSDDAIACFCISYIHDEISTARVKVQV